MILNKARNTKSKLINFFFYTGARYVELDLISLFVRPLYQEDAGSHSKGRKLEKPLNLTWEVIRGAGERWGGAVTKYWGLGDESGACWAAQPPSSPLSSQGCPHPHIWMGGASDSPGKDARADT